MATPFRRHTSCAGLADTLADIQQRLVKCHNVYKYNFVTFAGWMLGLLRGTSESVIDVVTNVRVIYGVPEWNAGGIDVRHF